MLNANSRRRLDIEAEFTNVGVNPALDRFTDLARQLRRL